MQLTINEVEMKTAITKYIKSQLVDSEQKDMNIELIAGRGANGFSATIDISDAPVDETTNMTGTELVDDFKPGSVEEQDVKDAIQEVNEIMDEAAQTPAEKPTKRRTKKKPEKTPESTLDDDLLNPVENDADLTEGPITDELLDAGPLDLADSEPVEENSEKILDTESGIDDVDSLFS